MTLMRNVTAGFAGLAALLVWKGAESQEPVNPLRIEIREGVIRPVSIAIPSFVFETSAAGETAEAVKAVVASDLKGTALFREIPEEAHISRISDFNQPVRYADWKAVNAEALVVGAVAVDGDTMSVKFRIFDVFSETTLGSGFQYTAKLESWRRIGHKIADTIYTRLTGETPYFDTRVAFISETGPKQNRVKRLAIMDYDGRNLEYLTAGNEIVLAPRFSPDGRKLIYTSYTTGVPRVHLLDLESREDNAILQSTDMTFAPRFSPDGSKVILSVTLNGNSDIYEVDPNTRQASRMTRSSAIDTAASYSPDGNWIVFESDRSLQPQIYIVRRSGGEPRRISFGKGSYGTPVWSPSGDYIAFTKQHAGRFHIGVMRADGSDERLLTASFLDEGPTWAPNGRVLMFFRELPGEGGGPVLFSVDVYGRNLKRVPTPGFASDPAWSPLRD